MAASYPFSVKSFVAKQDGQDINYAEDINEVYAEIVAIEDTLGANPYQNLTYTSLNGALTDLYQNKAAVTHTHSHSSLLGDAVGNDHPQYALLAGATFTGPVTVPPAKSGSQLATLGQLQAQGLASQSSVQSAINAQLANHCVGAQSASSALLGSATTFGFTLIGGYNEGCTDSAGHISCVFGGAFAQMVQTVTAIKANLGLGNGTPPQSFYPCSPATLPSTDITLSAITLNSATFLFSNHGTGAPLNNQLVAFSWSAMGL